MALATAGAIFWLSGRSDADAFKVNDACRNGIGGAPCADLRTSGNRDYALAGVAVVAAGALGATAAVLFLKAPSGAPREPRVACLPDLFRVAPRARSAVDDRRSLDDRRAVRGALDGRRRRLGRAARAP